MLKLKYYFTWDEMKYDKNYMEIDFSNFNELRKHLKRVYKMDIKDTLKEYENRSDKLIAYMINYEILKNSKMIIAFQEKEVF